jgi:hypothetical protein
VTLCKTVLLIPAIDQRPWSSPQGPYVFSWSSRRVRFQRLAAAGLCSVGTLGTSGPIREPEDLIGLQRALVTIRRKWSFAANQGGRGELAFVMRSAAVYSGTNARKH